MFKRTIVFLLLTIFSISSLWAADSKRFSYIGQNKEGELLTVVYFDQNKQEMLVRVLKTSEKTHLAPQNISSISEITPKGKFEVVDDRDYNLILDKDAKAAKELLTKYNKTALFLKGVNEIAFRPCPSPPPAQILASSGNAADLTNISLQIADKLVADNNKIIFKLDIAQVQYLMSTQLGPKGEILSLEFADATATANKKARGDLKIIGPQNGVAYLQKGSLLVLKVATENFTNSGGDFIVTVVDPAPSRADFIENLYHITIEGNKMTVNPRQIIASTLDFSSELKPTDGTDVKPKALGLQNILANVVWGGGKDKTQKEIVKAGKDAIKSDPLLKQYLTDADVERIAKRIIDDGVVIEKDAISEKPKVMGIAYLYFSEELLKKAILEQMPMSEAELTPIVNDVMANFRVCIKEAKFSGGVDDCKNKFASTAVLKVTKNILAQQIAVNLGDSISGPNAKQELSDAKAKGEIEYNRCINKNFTLPAEAASKSGKPAPDQMKVGISCVYSSLQYVVTKVVDKELDKTFKSMNIYRKGDDLVLSSISKSNDSCYQGMGITVDGVGRRYDMNRLQGLSVDNFKSGLIACANKQIATGGRLAVQRVIETHPDLVSILKSANVSEKGKATFVQNLLSTGYDTCLAELAKTLPKDSVVNPSGCEGFITLKAKEDAFRLVLRKELEVTKSKPDPWESDISPALSKCSDNFFSSYMTKKNPAPTEKELTVCFREAIANAGYYIGGALLNQEVVENPAIKPYGLTLSNSDKVKYQGMIKTCMARELKVINKVEELTAVDPKTKKSSLDRIKDKCTVEVAQVLVPDLAKDILKIEMGKAIEGEKPEDKAKLQAELDKIIDPIIKSELLPRMGKIQNMNDVTAKVLPAFTTEATLKAASTILDFKLSGFVSNPESKARMGKVRDTLVTDLRKELSGGGKLTPQVMSKVESKAIVLVSNTLIDQYFGKKYPGVAKTLISALDPAFLKAMTEVKFVSSGSSSGSSKPLDFESLANTLGQYIDEAIKYDPSIVDSVKDLQKKILADIAAQKKAGKTPTFSLDQMMKDYWNHPAIKKIILSQVSKELSSQFSSTLKTMEADDMRALTEPGNADLIRTKYSNLRALTTNATGAKQLDAMFSSPQGTKALMSIRDHMLIPLMNGKDATAQDKAAYTLEVAKTLIEKRSPGSFSERFAAHNLQAELTADKRSRGSVVKGIMSVLGYKIENYEWDNLRNTPSGRKALDYFDDQILLPSMTGQKFDMNARKEVIKELIKKGLKGD